MSIGTFDFSLKVVVIGDSCVGKTSLLYRIVRDEWTEKTQPTLGVEFMMKTVKTENHVMQLQMWDTAGHEIFRSVTKTYYRGAAAALILFDLSSTDSFAAADHWLRDVNDMARDDVVKILIGNKADLVEERRVNKEDAEAYAAEHNMTYFEVSAKTGENVPAVIEECVKQLEALVTNGAFNFSPGYNYGQTKIGDEEESSCC